MTERPILPVATGFDLDAWAVEHGFTPRRQNVDKDAPGFDDTLTGMRMEPDEGFRKRIIAQYRARIGVKPYAPSDAPRWPCPGQSDSPSDAELSAVVAEAIKAWKTARELPYLSPEACKQLNELIVAGLRPVLGGDGRERGR